MKYEHTLPAIFAERLNRFTAKVWTEEGKTEVHVKNTGRLGELLVPGAMVMLQEAAKPERKTAYDMIAVAKPGLGWVNIDSQACNAVMKEWLKKQDFDRVKPEMKYGDSRIDFYMERGEEKWLVEVKGCTLAKKDKGYFPDAPSERAVKHLKELAKAVKEGYHCAVAFVIAMEGIEEVLPNTQTDPDFARSLALAEIDGVEVWYMTCAVEGDSLEITGCAVKPR